MFIYTPVIILVPKLVLIIGGGLDQCFSNCGAVDPWEPPGGPRDPLTNAHHIYCNSSFVIFYILIHLITFVLPF